MRSTLLQGYHHSSILLKEYGQPPCRDIINPPTGALSNLLSGKQPTLPQEHYQLFSWGTINPPTVAQLTSTGAQSILKHGHNQPSYRNTMNNPTGAPLNLLSECNQPYSRNIINPPKGVWSTPPCRDIINPPTGALSTLLQGHNQPSHSSTVNLYRSTINPQTRAQSTLLQDTMNNPTGALSTLLSERNQPCSKDTINHPTGCIMNPSPEALVSTPFDKSTINHSAGT